MFWSLRGPLDYGTEMLAIGLQFSNKQLYGSSCDFTIKVLYKQFWWVGTCPMSYFIIIMMLKIYTVRYPVFWIQAKL